MYICGAGPSMTLSPGLRCSTLSYQARHCLRPSESLVFPLTLTTCRDPRHTGSYSWE